MKKYKHRKTGWIARKDNPDGQIYVVHKTNSFSFAIDRRLVEDSLDWEEIKELNYLILSLAYKGVLYNKISENEFFMDGSERTKHSVFFSSISEALSMGYTIHSVRRLSDDEVFTIGDKFNSSINKQVNNSLVISKLTISSAGNIILSSCMGSYGNIPYETCNLTEAIKVSKREKLLTTVDAVDVYDGDTCVLVDKSTMRICSKYYTASKHIDYTVNSGCLFFSNEEEAKDYILNNKRCLSFGDVKDLLPTDTPFCSLVIKNFKELVKERI